MSSAGFVETVQFALLGTPPYSVRVFYLRNADSGHRQNPDAAMPNAHGGTVMRFI
jgi:hypothetical protein